MHLLSQIIYSFKTLYMFRTVFPSIIRSSTAYTATVYVKELLLPAAIRDEFHLITDSISSLTYAVPVYAVLSS